MFRSGQRVVCVDDTGTAPNMNTVDPNFPAFEIHEGEEYVVSWCGYHHDPYYEGRYLGVRLAGVRRPTDPVSGESDKPFAAKRFRPVVTGRKEKRLEVAE